MRRDVWRLMPVEFKAYTLPEMPFYYSGMKPSEPQEPRYCGCGTKLARDNGNSICSPCLEKVPQAPPLAATSRAGLRSFERSESLRDEYRAVLLTIDSFPVEFLARDIAAAMYLPQRTVAAHLLRAERSNLVHRVRINRQGVTIWRRNKIA